MNILEKADEIVNKRSEEKERQYGPFKDSMIRAAQIYNAMSPASERMSESGMYRALIALKLSRQAYAHKTDNLLDACAYIGAWNNLLEEDPEALWRIAGTGGPEESSKDWQANMGVEQEKIEIK